MPLKSIKQHLAKALIAAERGDSQNAAYWVGFASGMVDELIRQEEASPAAQLGRLGGAVTAKRGPDYFRELAARRKTHGGGRPRKETK